MSKENLNEPYNVCIIGSGKWATTIAKIIAQNCALYSEFENTVMMYVYEEIVDGKKLTDIINHQHENVKYMPNYILPANLVAVNDIEESAHRADIIVIAVPAFFVSNCCKALLGKVKPTALAVSLIKGFETSKDGSILLLSRIIQRFLKIPVAVMVGCNLPNEIATNQFCEATIGCHDAKYHQALTDLFSSQFFRVDVTNDSECVELIAILKNIVGFAAGIADGMNHNENTKSGIIRRGFLEILHFVDIFYPGCEMITFFQSCTISDLVTVCYANRNRKLGEAFVKSLKPIEEIQSTIAPSYEPLGPYTVSVAYDMIVRRGLEDRFPFFTKIHRICTEVDSFSSLTDALRFARDDIYHPYNLIPL